MWLTASERASRAVTSQAFCFKYFHMLTLLSSPARTSLWLQKQSVACLKEKWMSSPTTRSYYLDLFMVIPLARVLYFTLYT